MIRRNAMSAAGRRALADALRHMHVDGVRQPELRRVGKLTAWHTQRAVSFPILPGRDDIGGPLTVDVVTPRHDDSSVAGGPDLPVNLAGGGVAAPVIFQAASAVQRRDGVEQGWAGDGTDGLGHAADVPPALGACHGAVDGGAAP